MKEVPNDGRIKNMGFVIQLGQSQNTTLPHTKKCAFMYVFYFFRTIYSSVKRGKSQKEMHGYCED